MSPYKNLNCALKIAHTELQGVFVFQMVIHFQWQCWNTFAGSRFKILNKSLSVPNVSAILLH